MPLNQLMIEKIAKTLSSKTRMRIIKILLNEDLTAIEVFNRYKQDYNDITCRESIYNDLEILTKSDILSKRYDSENKKLLYHLEISKIEFDLIKSKIITKKREDDKKNN